MGTHTGGSAGSGTKQRQSVTAGSRLIAAARRLLPAGREDMIGDSLESSRLDRFSEFAGSVYSAWKTKARRKYHVALSVRVDSPSQVEVRRRIDRTFWSLCRNLVMFTLAFGALCYVNEQMLPDVYHLHLWVSLGSCLPLAGIKALHRQGFEGGAPRVGMTAISDAAYVANLKRMVGVLVGGRFSPSEFAVRSAMDVFVPLMLFFSPAYVAVRWFAGDALPGVTGGPYDLLGRFAVGALMTLVYVSIRRSNRYAAAVMEDEIDALQAAMNSPVSA
jgi:hypothetical protein